MTPERLLMRPKWFVRMLFLGLAVTFGSLWLLDGGWISAFVTVGASVMSVHSWTNVVVLDGSDLSWRQLRRWRRVRLDRLKSIRSFRDFTIVWLPNVEFWIEDRDGNTFSFHRWYWESSRWPRMLRHIADWVSRSPDEVQIDERTRRRLGSSLGQPVARGMSKSSPEEPRWKCHYRTVARRAIRSSGLIAKRCSPPPGILVPRRRPA